MKKRDLINIIQDLETFQSPKIHLEQYQTDAIATSDLLYHIAYENMDLDGNVILDLGSGTGNISIAAALLGADVLSFEIDEDTIEIAKKNATSAEVSHKINFFLKDVKEITPNFIQEHIKKAYGKIVVITNPPFGVHKKGLDLLFLTKALEIGDIIYSIHLYSEKSHEFLEQKILKMGGIITEKSLLYMTLKHSYNFHKQKSKKITTIVYKIEKKNS